MKTRQNAAPENCTTSGRVERSEERVQHRIQSRNSPRQGPALLARGGSPENEDEDQDAAPAGAVVDDAAGSEVTW
ncbi:hypothetical protein RISK_004688 [Rhodopirellula islandica]|uniref:Uncharacterized protein n=1 Tax=Rhodopirellula islandica TaxID=595434 RepID=A0A0J1BA54_RHOIS|nr:hypothetical protein RISK_004688 [Rhodopirellula islandica]